ncbi:STOM [Mytilus coruscus]|uniref:STOM n=1 Tax=Mytilus coruscus TaxID=42192 RepID=A0A6J8DP45_MYTCO|nr:STOM [Mytilus coruscus]
MQATRKIGEYRYDYSSLMATDKVKTETGAARFKEPYTGPGCAGGILIGVSYFLCVLFFPFSLYYTIKVITEYERVVIFRLGRVLPGGAKGPGLLFILPCVDEIKMMDLRTVCRDIRPQKILTKDCVNITVDAVVYSRIFNPNLSVCYFENPHLSISIMAATTLRKTLGKRDMAEIICDRKKIAREITRKFDRQTANWGIKLERIEIKEIKLPKDMERSMAAEAEAARQARAKVITAKGEQNASRALKEAADIMSQSPAAIQLRYLQTLKSVATKNNSTILFPLPMQLSQGYAHS